VIERVGRESRSMMHRSLCISGLIATLMGCATEPPAADYGAITQVEPADAPGESTGLGAVGGAAAGGVIGSRIGGGAGNIVATVAGIIVGAAAGSATEAALQNASGLRYTVRLDDGRMMTVVQHREQDDKVIQPGERVMIRTSGWRQRVEPAAGSPAAKP
jgi:outer membrane lipoprotein SlyB